jgi:hypothetical protein
MSYHKTVLATGFGRVLWSGSADSPWRANHQRKERNCITTAELHGDWRNPPDRREIHRDRKSCARPQRTARDKGNYVVI